MAPKETAGAVLVARFQQSDPCIIHRDLQLATVFVATSDALKVGEIDQCVITPASFLVSVTIPEQSTVKM